jgi:sarcosine oxidase
VLPAGRPRCRHGRPAIVAAVERVEIAVVGSGVMGSAAARALGARGVPTVLLEQFGLGHARGSSHGATRIFRYSYPDPGYVRMAVLAREAWAKLADEAGEELLVPTGGLDAGVDAALCAAALAECGVPHSWLAGGELADRFPGIAARPGERMLFQADSGVLLAGRAVAALQRLAARDGVQLRDETPVLGIEPRDGRVLLRTAAGDICAGIAIVTAGGWMTGILAGAVPRVPRASVTLQRVRYFEPRQGSGGWPTLIEWQSAGPGWYSVPPAGVAPGVKVAPHMSGPEVDPRSGPFGGVDAEAEAQVADYVRERLPGLDPAGFAAETCLYTTTPDEAFVLDRSGDVVVGGGGSGHAFKFGPLIGEILADLALGQPPAVPLARFSLTR